MDYKKALDYYDRSFKISEKIGDKYGMGITLNNIGDVHYDKGEYEKAEEYLKKALSIKKEIGVGTDELVVTTTSLFLTFKYLSKEYDENKIHMLIKEAENIEYDLNYRIYQLLEDKSYLETAYNQTQEKADAMDDELKEKFLTYPIPKQIIEEYILL